MDPRQQREYHYHPRAPPFPPPFAINPPSPKSSSEFPILAIAILGIVTTAFLLVSYYVFVIKCCLNWHRIDLLRRFSNSRARRDDDLLMVYTPGRENHGLHESIIRTIPILKFKREGGEEVEEKKILECVVCLNEFQEEETLRLLPNCNHAFHIDCIDIWLQSNANCPLCRSNISNTNPIPTNQIMVQGIDQEFNQCTNNLINGGDDIVIELSGHGSDQTPVNRDMGSSVVEVSLQSTNTQHSPSPRKLEQRFLQKKQRNFQHVSSMGDECIDVREKDDQFSIQPIRRSFSMDSSADRQLYLSVQEILQHNQIHLNEFRTSEGSSRVRRSFFSFGHGRGSRNAVLPIQFEP